MPYDLKATIALNPDLPVEFIKETLIADQEAKNGQLIPYKFR